MCGGITHRKIAQTRNSDLVLFIVPVGDALNNSTRYPKPRFLSVVIGLIGALLLWMGVLLMAAGGSLYYAFAGVVLLGSAVFLFRGDVRGAQLYGAFLLFTYLWALYESGLDAWALMPRVAMFSVLGLWFVL
ncbi:MAG: glucose dehydrogenase, partial [Pseudohongiellaceae bacterium]